MGRKDNSTKRREQIIWGLYACLVEKGQEKVTVKTIAAKAGLPPGVIHYYFKSKDEIVSNLAETLVRKYSKMIYTHLKEAQSAEQQIDLAIDFIINRLIFDLPLNRVFYNLIQMSFERKELDSVIKNMFENYRGQLAEVFKVAMTENERDMLGASLLAVTEGFSLQLMVDPDAFDKADVKRIFTKLTRNHFAMLNHGEN
jgi:AcrR family transcriptional regulator